MRSLFFAFLISLSTLSFVDIAKAGQEEFSMVLVGDKEQVLSLLHKSMQAEFTNANIGDWNGRIGYWAQFSGFFTGKTGLGVSISPLADGDGMETSAYKLNFGYETEYMDGMTHVKSLKEQIVKQAKLTGTVSIPEKTNSYKSLVTRADQCLSILENDPDLVLISKKIALSNYDDASFLMLANEDKVTESEKPIIMLWADKREKCNSLRKTAMSFFPLDPHASIALDTLSESNQLILNLYKGTLSYGEFNNKRKILANESKKKNIDVSEKLSKDREDKVAREDEINRQNQIERNRLLIEQQKADAIRNQTNNIQLPTPRTTNCTSHVIGNTVQTYCN